MTDKMREEFKVWARSRGMSLPVNDDIHYNQWTQLAWESWQASRASLVVELPDAEGCSVSGEYREGRSIMRSECEAAIEAAGLKVANQ